MRFGKIAGLAAAVLLVSAVALFAQAGTISAIEISGNKNINSDTILNALGVKVGDDATDANIDKGRDSIMALGYFSVVTIHRDRTDAGTKVTYEVTEYSKIADIKIEGSDPVAPESLLEVMRTKPGQVLNDTTLNRDIEAIQTYYGDAGYIAYVTEDIAVDPETGILTVPILVHKVESVEFTGLKKTKEYVLTREMKTKPGKVFNVKTLREDIIEIYNLDLFEDIQQYRISPGVDPGTVKIVIPVVEKKTGRVSFGLGYSSKQRLIGQVSVSETNFRGRGEGLNLLFEQGTTQAVGGRYSYELGFFEPWIDKKETSLNVNLYNKIRYRFSSGVFSSNTKNKDDFYNERRKGADVTLGRPLSDKSDIYLTARAENVETNPQLLSLNLDNNLLTIAQEGDVYSGTLKYVRNTRDIDLDPAAGSYASYAVEVGHGDTTRYKLVPGLDAGGNPTNLIVPSALEGMYEKFTVDYRRYFSKGGAKTAVNDKRTTFAVRLRAGISGGDIPFFEQFFVGGGESLRGYKEDRFWGDKMAVASLEFRKPLAQSVVGVIFCDYGSAWGGDPWYTVASFPQSNGFKGHFGAGLGLRINTPIGNLRLDYGHGSEGGRTHFSIGHAF